MPLSCLAFSQRTSSVRTKSSYSFSERSQPLPPRNWITPSLTANLPLFMMCQPSRLLPSNRLSAFSWADASGAASSTDARHRRRGTDISAPHPRSQRSRVAGGTCRPPRSIRTGESDHLADRRRVRLDGVLRPAVGVELAHLTQVE